MQIAFQEDEWVLWCIESPTAFRNYLEALSSQVLGEEGDFVLSDQDRLLDIGKCVDLIWSPYTIDVNEKRCLNKIYTQLKEEAFDENHFLQTRQLLSDIYSYFTELEQGVDVELDYGEEVEFSQLLKAINVKVEVYKGDTLSALGQYLQVMTKLLEKKILVFVNLSAYLEKSEIEELIREAFYLKLQIILVEQKEINLALPCKRYIIDQDRCEIF